MDNWDLGKVGPEGNIHIDEKGHFQCIIYANLLYGKPNLRDATNVDNLLNNPDTFPQILVPPPCDWFEQTFLTTAAFMSAYQFWKFAQFILSITQ